LVQTRIRYCQRKDYEVIEELRDKYPVLFLCRIMDINRAGYYKWKARQGHLNRYEQDRQLLTELLKEEHKKHKSLGYRRLAYNIRVNTGWVFSDNLAHKCCKTAGIRSQARRYRYRKPGTESIKFENLVHGNWNANEPLQIVVSDMTVLANKKGHYEWTLLLDTFNNEIIAHSVSPKAGDAKPYYHCLDILMQRVGNIEEQRPQVVFHTDQGSVYSSRAFCQAHMNYNIIRSMSRGGTPTDNPIIEALNGWIKQELYLDYGLKNADDVPALLDAYVEFFNTSRPAAALGYKSPVRYKSELGF
jgi:putative transposase